MFRLRESWTLSCILSLPLLCQSVHAKVKYNISTGAIRYTDFGAVPSGAKWGYWMTLSGRPIFVDAREGTFGSPWLTPHEGASWVGRTTWEQPAGDYSYFLNLGDLLRPNHPAAIRYRIAADNRFAVTFENLTCSGDCSPTGEGYTALSPSYSATIRWSGSGSPTMRVVVTNGSQGPTGLLVEGTLYACTYEPTPASVTLSPTGAAVPVVINTNASSCEWALPSIIISWMRLSAPDKIGQGTIQVSADTLVAPQGPRSTTLRVLDPDIGTVSEIPVTQSGCIPLLLPNPNPLNFPANGGIGSVSLAITQGCAWTTVNDSPSWISITGGSGNTGGNVGLTVAPNSSVNARQATLTIAGQNISVNQAGACSHTVSPASLTFSSGGGSQAVSLGASSAGCSWIVSARPAWITVDASSGSGSRSLTLTAEANTGTTARSGTVVVAGLAINVTQSPPSPCTYTLNPGSMLFDHNGGSRTATITTNRSDCTWSTATPSWITISPSSGSGTSSLTLTVPVHSGTTARLASVTIGGQPMTVRQEPPEPPCTFVVTPEVFMLVSFPSRFTVNVNASRATCTWTVQNVPPWIQTSVSGGAGSATISFDVQMNEGTTSRVATLQIAGHNVAVTQTALDGACTSSLDRDTLRMNAAGALMDGVQAVTLTTSTPDCRWDSSVPPAWLTFTPRSGRGPASISFSGQPNPNPTSRTALIVIGGGTLRVTQEAAQTCTFSLQAGTTTFGANGGTGTIQLTASPSGCAWSVTNPAAWVTFQQMSGTGSATIGFSVAANPSASPRTATVSIGGQPLSIQQLIQPATPTRLVTVAPCRLVETRAEYNFEGRTGPFGPPFLAAGETRTFVPSASTVCRGIPASARAFVLNVTVQPRGPVDYVTVFPGGDPMPTFYTVRSQDGLVVANSAIVAAGTGGAVSMYASQATDIIIDISGYFTDDPRESNLAFYPLTPCRVIDTRAPYRPQPGPFGPPSLFARQRRDFRFPSTPYCQIPTGAAAYSVTITVVPSNPLAFLTAWPAGGMQPNVSSINSPNGRTLANSVILPSSGDGSVSLYPFDNTDAIIDINGYFAPDDGVNGLFFYPVRQCRVVDTSTSTGGVFGGPMFDDQSQRTIPIPSHTGCGVPATARAYALNASVVPAGSPVPFLTVWPSGQSQPNASVINAFEGQTVSSGFLVPAGNGGSVVVYAFRRTHVVLEIAGYFTR